MSMRGSFNHAQHVRTAGSTAASASKWYNSSVSIQTDVASLTFAITAISTVCVG